MQGSSSGPLRECGGARTGGGGRITHTKALKSPATFSCRVCFLDATAKRRNVRSRIGPSERGSYHLGKHAGISRDTVRQNSVPTCRAPGEGEGGEKARCHQKILGCRLRSRGMGRGGGSTWLPHWPTCTTRSMGPRPWVRGTPNLPALARAFHSEIASSPLGAPGSEPKAKARVGQNDREGEGRKAQVSQESVFSQKKKRERRVKMVSYCHILRSALLVAGGGWGGPQHERLAAACERGETERRP